LKAAMFLATSALLNPAYAVPRVWNQVVKSKVNGMPEAAPPAELAERPKVQNPKSKIPVESCCPS
jgi:hypothetical protein